jgi:uncharacterized low-complexity protein
VESKRVRKDSWGWNVNGITLTSVSFAEAMLSPRETDGGVDGPDADVEAEAEIDAGLDVLGSKSAVAVPAAEGRLGFVMRRPRRSKAGEGGSSSAARLARRLGKGRVLLIETRARAAEGSCWGGKKCEERRKWRGRGHEL